MLDSGQPQNDLRFYGYKHWTLEDQPRCFNVGKGLKGRPFQKNNRNHKWLTIVKRYGLRVEICIGPIEHFDACSWEIEWIAKEDTFTINHSHDDPNDIRCNFTRGGEGGFGRIRSDQERAQHSLKAKAQWVNPEMHALMVSKLKAAWTDPEVIEKHRVAAKIVMADPAVKAKHKESLSRPDVKTKHSASAIAYWRDHPEELAKRTESQRKAWIKRKAKNNE